MTLDVPKPPYKASPSQLLSSSELQTLLRVTKAFILPLEIHNPGLLHKAFNRTFNYEAVGLLERHDFHKFKFNYVKQHICVISQTSGVNCNRVQVC